MQTHVLPEGWTQIENWWWDRSSAARWILGSMSLALMTGVLGGALT